MISPVNEPTVIYADPQFLILNKPTGLIVHGARHRGTSPTTERTLVDWLLDHYPDVKNVGDDLSTRPGIVHRLDRGTSGVMLVALTNTSFAYLKSLFQQHRVLKTYMALVAGRLKSPEGVIEQPIGIANGTLKRSVRSEKMRKPAVTRYRVKTIFELPPGNEPRLFSLVEVYPETGRTHQIRVHLASIGHPIVGDSLYGGRRQPSWAGRIMLHAASVRFPLESGSLFEAAAEPPADYQKAIDFLTATAEITYPQHPRG